MTDPADDSTNRTGIARWLFAVRQTMKEAITAELVLNPAFDMLLMLHAEQDRDASISSTDICAETGVTDTVCHHWARALQQRGLIEIADERFRLTADGRRTMDGLSEKVSGLLATHFGARSTPRPSAAESG